jgi:hypothetical protein
MYMAVYSSALLTVAAVSSATYVSQDIDQRECCWVNLMLLPVVAWAEWLNVYIDEEPAGWKVE